jgi:hypothetical protein
MLSRTAEGDRPRARQDFGMHQALGFLSARQRRLAWVGFLLTALQAPVAARLLADGSWFFSVCVALMVATVIIADDAARRRPADGNPAE